MAAPTALPDLTADQLAALNKMCPVAAGVPLGTLLQSFITLLNALLAEAVLDGYTS